MECFFFRFTIWLSFQLIAKNKKKKQEEVNILQNKKKFQSIEKHDERQDSSQKQPTEKKPRRYEQGKVPRGQSVENLSFFFLFIIVRDRLIFIYNRLLEKLTLLAPRFIAFRILSSFSYV